MQETNSPAPAPKKKTAAQPARPQKASPSQAVSRNTAAPNRKPTAQSAPRTVQSQKKTARPAASFALPIPQKWIRPLKLFAFDIAMIGIGLLIFAYFHHVRPVAYSTKDVITVSRPTQNPSSQTTDLSQTSASTDAPSAESQPTATPDPNDWGAKFADKFTSGSVETTETSYRSQNVSISISRHSQMDEGDDPQVWFVADIYIRDIDSLTTALARGVYGKGYKEWPLFMANEQGAILAISGDYYGAREKGVVIRNGSVYRTDTFKDVCIIYYDGVMETMTAKEFDADAAIERGAYQAFSFGPALLDADGKVKASYDTEINDPNPRCAIGYFEPGHYCFVVADGRDFDYSEGLEMHELAQIFEDLGCASAYNLDGGATAAMVFMDKIVNSPYDGGRKVSDIICIGEAAK